VERVAAPVVVDVRPTRSARFSPSSSQGHRARSPRPPCAPTGSARSSRSPSTGSAPRTGSGRPASPLTGPHARSGERPPEGTRAVRVQFAASSGRSWPPGADPRRPPALRARAPGSAGPRAVRRRRCGTGRPSRSPPGRRSPRKPVHGPQHVVRRHGRRGRRKPPRHGVAVREQGPGTSPPRPATFEGPSRASQLAAGAEPAHRTSPPARTATRARAAPARPATRGQQLLGHHCTGVLTRTPGGASTSRRRRRRRGRTARRGARPPAWGSRREVPVQVEPEHRLLVVARGRAGRRPPAPADARAQAGRQRQHPSRPAPRAERRRRTSRGAPVRARRRGRGPAARRPGPSRGRPDPAAGRGPARLPPLRRRGRRAPPGTAPPRRVPQVTPRPFPAVPPGPPVTPGRAPAVTPSPGGPPRLQPGTGCRRRSWT
jgi:hypothetical protein